jgi:hypothetical protein
MTLLPGQRPRSNPTRHARADERLAAAGGIYGDQLTAPGRVSVHSVFGYDERTLLVQGQGLRRGDRFYFQAGGLLRKIT